MERAFLHLTYLSMNLRWNSERIVSLMKCFSWADIKQWKIQWTFLSHIVQLKYAVTAQTARLKLFATFQTGRLYSSLPEPPFYCVWPFSWLLENVEHCGGEPEQAGTGILCHDEWMSDVTSSNFKFLMSSKLTRWTSHYLTPCRWIHWTRQTPHCVRFVYQA